VRSSWVRFIHFAKDCSLVPLLATARCPHSAANCDVWLANTRIYQSCRTNPESKINAADSEA
jgi:hypothetical protein